ncbi:MAG: hypothetical protein J6S67_20840 [Methanobrevibacter sp.]|nr:hypothetical protein [Methanobrevibacter sp.]
MTKYKIYVNPNNQQTTQPQNNNAQLVQQLAQQAANQQMQTQAQPTPQPAGNDMRQIVNEMIKNKLTQSIEVPKEYTIKDLLQSNLTTGKTFTDKLENLSNYLDSVEAARNIGNLMGTSLYNPNTGRMERTGSRLAKERELKLQQEQEKARQEQKQQKDLAADMYKNYLTEDLANQELEWKKEKAAQEMKLEREKMQNALQRAYLIHGNSGGDIKMTAAEGKQLTENKTTLANIEAGLQALEENPNAYQWYKGILGADVANRIDPKGVGTRTQIDNITAVYRKWLTGAQMSDKERKAYERFLPAPTDNYTIVKAKLNGMKGAIERSNNALLSNYGISEQNNKKDSLGLGI